MTGLYGESERESPLVVVLHSPLREDRLQCEGAGGGYLVLANIDDH